MSDVVNLLLKLWLSKFKDCDNRMIEKFAFEVRNQFNCGLKAHKEDKKMWFFSIEQEKGIIF